MEKREENSYSVAILVVSDSVSAGQKDDTSGKAIENLLQNGTIFHVNSLHYECVPDEISLIKYFLESWSNKIDLILTVGGTGFSPRDVTPEATKAVLDREAPHLASRMVQGCWEKSKFSVLSRSVCGTRGKCLILNLPGSAKGAVECFEVIGFLLPHAMDQLKSESKRVAALHEHIQAQ